MNNAVFGKTMKNVRNHVDVQFLTHWDGRYSAEAMIAKPHFHSRSVFSENLVAIEMRKLEVKFNKPIYVCVFSTYPRRVCMKFKYMLPTSICYRCFVKNVKSYIPTLTVSYITSSVTTYMISDETRF